MLSLFLRVEYLLPDTGDACSVPSFFRFVVVFVFVFVFLFVRAFLYFFLPVRAYHPVPQG